MSNYTIRPAQPADAGAVLPLQRTEFRQYMQRSDDTAEDLAESIRGAANYRSTWLVAESSAGDVIGYAFGEPWAQSGYSSDAVAKLVQVAVAPDSRAGGVGAALVDEVMTGMSLLGFETIIANVPRSLAEWYASSGFSVLRGRAGLAWVQCPGPGSEMLAPADWPLQKRLTDSPRFAIFPDGNGYDHLAFAELRPQAKILAWAPFAPGSMDTARRRAGRAVFHVLLSAGEQAWNRLSPGAQSGLQLDAMNANELRNWQVSMRILMNDPVEQPMFVPA